MKKLITLLLLFGSFFSNAQSKSDSSYKLWAVDTSTFYPIYINQNYKPVAYLDQNNKLTVNDSLATIQTLIRSLKEANDKYDRLYKRYYEAEDVLGYIDLKLLAEMTGKKKNFINALKRYNKGKHER